jgi:hypothetical protein
MGTPYAGLNSNVALPTSLSIQSSTAASPTVIQTVLAHGLTTGDYVDIVGHTTNTGANCINQPVTVIDTTHFSIAINTSAGAAGGATGLVFPQQFTGNISLNPANGDALAASTWIPGMSCLTDRTTGLLARMGAYKLVNDYTISSKQSDPKFTTQWFNFSSSSANYVPATLSAAQVEWGPIYAATTDVGRGATYQLRYRAIFLIRDGGIGGWGVRRGQWLGAGILSSYGRGAKHRVIHLGRISR